MGLPWVRLDTQFATNPKVLYLVQDKAFRALTVYICGLGYCGVHGTDGLIPKAALPFLHGTTADAKRLVDVGLWHESPASWEVNGWNEFQESNDETQARSERARQAALKRWSKDSA